MSNKITAYIQSIISTIKHGTPTGNGTVITLATLVGIYSLSVVTSLPGLAIAPILGDLQTFFKGASQLKIQMLESLPSLVIIPFILISGRLSVHFDKHILLMSGLGIFFSSSILYMVTENLDFMLVNSVLLGVGAGVVIPLSTGLIADYFSGRERTKQLGVVSAISNISLVSATMIAGFLADISWRYAFLVYTLSLISIIFARNLRPKNISQSIASEKVANTTTSSNYAAATIAEPTYYKPLLKLHIRTAMPVGIMLFYFFITTIVLVVPFNLAIYTQHFHSAGVEMGGIMISVFFMSITLPGLLINRIEEYLGKRTFFYGVCMMAFGLLWLLLPTHQWAIWIAIVLIGVSYGTLQPLIYDRTATFVPAKEVTFALSLVMSMNYIAIIFYPFFQKLQSTVFFTESQYLPFIVSAAMALIYVGVKFKNKE